MVEMERELKELLHKPLLEIIGLANELRNRFCGSTLHLCAIVNARSGLCSGDCKYCAQSRVSKAEIEVYPLKSKDEILESARAKKVFGAQRFSIVTSGERISDEELDRICEVIPEIRAMGLEVCASLGMLSRDQLRALKSAGLTRYHHNIETSPSFYPKVVSTHRFEERIRTIRLAKEEGLEVCSGGIIGMGEDWEDRINMALTLRDLDVDSVPLNFLIPIPGTPLQGLKTIDPISALKVIALFRVALPDKEIRLIAGRERVFGPLQLLAFLSGANGMMVGGYLTVPGAEAQEDARLVRQIEEEFQKIC